MLQDSLVLHLQGYVQLAVGTHSAIFTRGVLLRDGLVPKGHVRIKRLL